MPKFLRFPLCLLVVLASLTDLSPAQADSKGMQAIRQEALTWLSGQVAQTYPDSLPRVEIGQIDGRLRLDDCESLRFFLPAGARLWAGGSLGLKCAAPSKWTLYLTYQVNLAGPALAALKPLPARHLLGPGDVALTNVPYVQDPGAYLRDIPPGATTQRPIMASQALLVHDLILPDVIQAGAKVLVKVQGNGFSVAQEGKALNAAKAGGAVKVKMPNGRIVRGRANRDGEVEISP
jgi:flagella basal body P-ring formation protein FlgA